MGATRDEAKSDSAKDLVMVLMVNTRCAVGYWLLAGTCYSSCNNSGLVRLRKVLLKVL